MVENQTVVRWRMNNRKLTLNGNSHRCYISMVMPASMAELKCIASFVDVNNFGKLTSTDAPDHQVSRRGRVLIGAVRY